MTAAAVRKYIGGGLLLPARCQNAAAAAVFKCAPTLLSAATYTVVSALLSFNLTGVAQ